MRRGYSREAIKGRYQELVEITDRSIERDRNPRPPGPGGAGHAVHGDRSARIRPDRLGADGVRPGHPHHHPVHLNVLVTRQRPTVLLRHPKYRRAKARVFELGEKMIADQHARIGTGTDARPNLVDDIMDAHHRDPGLMPADDLILNLIGPYVAGLDTVANVTKTAPTPGPSMRFRVRVDGHRHPGRPAT